MSNKTECVVCMKEVNLLDHFNGEMLCKECYNNPENHVFGMDEEGVYD